MSQALADTSFFVGVEAGRIAPSESLPDELAVSVITIGELRAGVLAARDGQTRDLRLTTLQSALSWNPQPIDQRVAETWARLRILLAQRHRRMPVNDSWIAATAMALGVPVLTQDDDYDVGIPELAVIHV